MARRPYGHGIDDFKTHVVWRFFEPTVYCWDIRYLRRLDMSLSLKLQSDRKAMRRPLPASRRKFFRQEGGPSDLCAHRPIA